jgi:hypothetical protein
MRTWNRRIRVRQNRAGRISEAAYLLYKVIASRNQKRFTALLTSVDFDKWGDYLSDGPLTMASLTVWSKE